MSILKGYRCIHINKQYNQTENACFSNLIEIPDNHYSIENLDKSLYFSPYKMQFTQYQNIYFGRNKERKEIKKLPGLLGNCVLLW